MNRSIELDDGKVAVGVRKTREETNAEILHELQQIKEIQFSVKANEGKSNEIFGSVSSSDIAEQLQTQHGIVVDKDLITDDASHAVRLKKLGEYVVQIRTSKQSEPVDLKIKVVPKQD